MRQEVIVFTAPGCQGCQRLKEFLHKKDVPFTEKDIGQDEATRKELAALGLKGTPITVIGEKAVSGFDPRRIEELLLQAA